MSLTKKAIFTAFVLSIAPVAASAQNTNQPVVPSAGNPLGLIVTTPQTSWGWGVSGQPRVTTQPRTGVSIPREDRPPSDPTNRFTYDPEDRDYDLAGNHVPALWTTECPADELAWLLGEPTAAATVLRDVLIRNFVHAHNVRIMPEVHATNWSHSAARLTINHHMSEDLIVSVSCY